MQRVHGSILLSLCPLGNIAIALEVPLLGLEKELVGAFVMGCSVPFGEAGRSGGNGRFERITQCYKRTSFYSTAFY